MLTRKTVVAYYFTGRTRCSFDGNKCFDCRPGDLSLLSPGLAHCDSPFTPNVEYLSLKIKKQFFLELFADLGAASGETPYFPATKVQCDRSIRRICEVSRAELSRQEFGQESMLSSLVTELAVVLVRRFRPAAFDKERLESDPRLAPWQVRKVLEFVHETYAQEFSLDGIASAAGVSKFYLERLFKKDHGPSAS